MDVNNLTRHVNHGAVVQKNQNQNTQLRLKARLKLKAHRKLEAGTIIGRHAQVLDAFDPLNNLNSWFHSLSMPKTHGR